MSADTFFFFHHANTYEDKGNWQNEYGLHSYQCLPLYIVQSAWSCMAAH